LFLRKQEFRKPQQTETDMSDRNGYSRQQNERDHHRNYRGLWAAVVMQAKDDIAGEPINSIEYGQAVAFFTGSGELARTRTGIGDMLELHSDDLEAFGRHCINQRLAAEGLPPLPPRQAPKHQPKPAAGLLARTAPSPARAAPPPESPTPVRRTTTARQPQRAFNPFFPRGIYAGA
jgi:hypothetical protein